MHEDSSTNSSTSHLTKNADDPNLNTTDPVSKKGNTTKQINANSPTKDEFAVHSNKMNLAEESFTTAEAHSREAGDSQKIPSITKNSSSPSKAKSMARGSLKSPSATSDSSRFSKAARTAGRSRKISSVTKDSSKSSKADSMVGGFLKISSATSDPSRYSKATRTAGGSRKISGVTKDSSESLKPVSTAGGSRKFVSNIDTSSSEKLD